MLRRFLKRIFLKMSLPLRYLVRYELDKHHSLYAMQNIRRELQRMATRSTAEYVEQHMRHIDSVANPYHLLTESFTMSHQANGGLICEFGVYSGTTINRIASRTKDIVYGFDSFEGLPERWRDGIGKGSFRYSTHPEVLPNVVLIDGWFHESLPPFLEKHSGDARFLHIDCDLYSSTKTILDLMRERIKPGCVLVFNEYFNYFDNVTLDICSIKLVPSSQCQTMA